MNSLWTDIDPATLLEGATGAGVSVAVIDTGLDYQHPELGGVRCRLKERVTFVSGQPEPESDPTDPASHGTPVTWLIHQVAPEAELAMMRALSRDARGQAEGFESALRYAIENDYKVINMSLGLESYSDRWTARFLQLANEAYYRGQILVASASNRSERILPGCISSLISVDMDYFQDPREFRPRDRQSILHGPRPHIWLDAMGTMVEAPKAGTRGRMLYTGTSFAAPHITGIVALLLSRYPDLAPFEVKTVLNRLGAFYSRRAKSAARS